MSKNVLIPLALLTETVDLLGYWNIFDYDPALHERYYNVFWGLSGKLQKLELRDAYSKIIAADNPDDRHNARISYLQQKHWIEDDPPF